VFEIARRGRWELVLSNAAGGRETVIDAEADGSSGGSWSPDSQWVAYLRVKGGVRQIAKIIPGSGTPIVIANAGPVFSTLTARYETTQWSPSGDWILYPSVDGFSLISPDGSSNRKLTSRQFLAYGFSKDGTAVLGIFHNTMPNAAEWQLCSVDVKTGSEKLLAPLDLPPSTANVTSFSLHPDGKRFLTSIAKWPYEIWMLQGFDQRKSWVDRILQR
jgi:WD40 repeat protein